MAKSRADVVRGIAVAVAFAIAPFVAEAQDRLVSSLSANGGVVTFGTLSSVLPAADSPIAIRVTSPGPWRVTAEPRFVVASTTDESKNAGRAATVRVKTGEGRWERLQALPLPIAAGGPADGEVILLNFRVGVSFSDSPGVREALVRLTLNPANVSTDIVLRWTVAPTLVVKEIGEAHIASTEKVTSPNNYDFLEKTYLVTANVDWVLSLRVANALQNDRFPGARSIYAYAVDGDAPRVSLDENRSQTVTSGPATEEGGRLIHVRFGVADPTHLPAGTYRGEVEANVEQSTPTGDIHETARK